MKPTILLLALALGIVTGACQTQIHAPSMSQFAATPSGAVAETFWLEFSVPTNVQYATLTNGSTVAIQSDYYNEYVATNNATNWTFLASVYIAPGSASIGDFPKLTQGPLTPICIYGIQSSNSVYGFWGTNLTCYTNILGVTASGSPANAAGISKRF